MRLLGTIVGLLMLSSCQGQVVHDVENKRIRQDTLHDISLQNRIYKGEKYKILDLKNIENDAREIHIVSANRTVGHITLPLPDDYSGFAVNWIKETNSGFEISIEYGSRLYYQKDFEFTFGDNTFYLNKIKEKSFDKNKPEKVKSEIISVSSRISISEFSITDYMK